MANDPPVTDRRSRPVRAVASFQQGSVPDTRRGLKNNTRPIWVCSHCGAADVWGPGWMWYGSYQELSDLPDGQRGIREVLCPNCTKALKIEPRDD